MILDTLTYSVITVAAAMSFIVNLLASLSQDQPGNRNKQT